MQLKPKQFLPWWYFCSPTLAVPEFLSYLSRREDSYLPAVAVFIAMIYPYLGKFLPLFTGYVCSSNLYVGIRLVDRTAVSVMSD